MPARDELVASERTDEEVAEIIGADWLVYQAIEDLEGKREKKEILKLVVLNAQFLTGVMSPEILMKPT